MPRFPMDIQPPDEGAMTLEERLKAHLSAQARSVEEHRQYSQKLEGKLEESKIREEDLLLTDRLLKLTDPEVPKSARQFLFKEMAKAVGVDPKSEPAKDVGAMLVGMDPQSLQGIRAALTSQLDNAPAGIVNKITKGLLSGDVPMNDFIGFTQQAVRAQASQPSEEAQAFQAIAKPGDRGEVVLAQAKGQEPARAERYMEASPDLVSQLGLDSNKRYRVDDLINLGFRNLPTDPKRQEELTKNLRAYHDGTADVLSQLNHLGGLVKGRPDALGLSLDLLGYKIVDYHGPTWDQAVISQIEGYNKVYGTKDETTLGKGGKMEEPGTWSKLTTAVSERLLKLMGNESQDAAITHARINALLVSLAYGLASAKDPGGRLSDRDVQAVMAEVGKSADPESFVAVIKDLAQRTYDTYARRTRIATGREVDLVPRSLPDNQLKAAIKSEVTPESLRSNLIKEYRQRPAIQETAPQAPVPGKPPAGGSPGSVLPGEGTPVSTPQTPPTGAKAQESFVPPAPSPDLEGGPSGVQPEWEPPKAPLKSVRPPGEPLEKPFTPPRRGSPQDLPAEQETSPNLKVEPLPPLEPEQPPNAGQPPVSATPPAAAESPEAPPVPEVQAPVSSTPLAPTPSETPPVESPVPPSPEQPAPAPSPQVETPPSVATPPAEGQEAAKPSAETPPLGPPASEAKQPPVPLAGEPKPIETPDQPSMKGDSQKVPTLEEEEAAKSKAAQEERRRISRGEEREEEKLSMDKERLSLSRKSDARAEESAERADRREERQISSQERLAKATEERIKVAKEQLEIAREKEKRLIEESKTKTDLDERKFAFEKQKEARAEREAKEQAAKDVIKETREAWKYSSDENERKERLKLARENYDLAVKASERADEAAKRAKTESDREFALKERQEKRQERAEARQALKDRLNEEYRRRQEARQEDKEKKAAAEQVRSRIGAALRSLAGALKGPSNISGSLIGDSGGDQDPRAFQITPAPKRAPPQIPQGGR